MKQTFTAGPWNIHPHYAIDAPVKTTTPDERCPVPFDYWTGTIAQGDKIVAIAEMQTTNGGWPHVEDVEEARANAYLIAAAPEMYEALYALMNLDDDPNAWDEACALAKAALTKAEAGDKK